ncbi:MAG: hypothetical protein HDS80_06625 [Bacteroidales bacterium]|nr:hypothetical protein [Bacteroidales bacterium]
MKNFLFKISAFFIILISMSIPSGCTHANGDIGPLFGTWAFDKITVDDNPIPDYTEGLMISFQGSFFIIDRVEMDLIENYQRIYGKWEREGDTMTFDGKEEYLAGTFPEELGVAPNGSFSVRVISESNKEMVWQRIGDDGKIWIYTLRKLI